jgi:tRNA 2-thiouridine synthesizing protein E
MQTLVFETDTHGYLRDIQAWTQEIAQVLASQEGIVLLDVHWTVVIAIRQFYLTHGTIPPMRGLLVLLKDKLTSEQNTSLYLQQLFPKGLLRQVSKIAGLPKPVRCI